MFNISGRNRSLKLATLLASTTILVACGGGGGGSSDATAEVTAETTTIRGSAVKGVISNGLVRAYRVVNNAGVMEADDTLVAPIVRTDASGAFELTLNEALRNDTILIEVGADGLTRMTCDVTAGCGTDGSGNTIDFGDQFSLSADFSMLGVVTNVSSGQTVSGHLNPMTHMAVAQANATIEGLSVNSINTALRAVEGMLSLESGALNQQAADITSLDASATPSKAELETGVMSAAFMSLVNTPDWDGIEEVLAHVESRMANNSQLASVNNGALRDVTLDDLFDSAVEIADDLVAAAPASAYAQMVTEISTEASIAYNQVVENGQLVTPVSITTQPQSAETDEGGNVTLSIGATGGGQLAFQWRKNGVAINGANAASYTISAAELADAGIYDVIVSNSVGAVASNGALLVVNEIIVEPTLGSIALRWDIPAQRADGTDLELYEIDGYVIAYGTTAGQLTSQMNIVGAGETSALIEDLTPATYYFAIATVDSEGRQSAYSSVISQTVM